MSTKGVYEYDSTQDRLTQIADYSADQLSDIVNVYGAKNLCPIQVDSQIFRGITYTVNSDNSITVSGTVESGYNNANLNISEFSVKNLIGKKILMSGGNSLSNSLYLYFDCMASDGTRIKRNEVKTSEPLEYTIPSNASYFRVSIIMLSTFSGTATTIYPMIRLASIEDDTYVPYAMTNQQLTGLYDNEVEMGTVNLLPYPYYHTSRVSEGITYVDNGDGTINCNGTATNNTSSYFALFYTGDENLYNKLFAGKTIKLSGASSNAHLRIEVNGSMVVTDTGDGVEYTCGAFNNKFSVNIRIYQGYTVNNVTVKPMITLASQPNSDYAHYVPYAKTNKELTDDKAEKIDLTSINITSGTTNNTGSTIASSTFFYYKGSLVRAKTDIADGATLTENTNYEAVTAGGLNQLNSDLTDLNSALSNIGTYKIKNTPNTVSVTINTSNNIAIIDLTPGVWMLFGVLRTDTTGVTGLLSIGNTTRGYTTVAALPKVTSGRTSCSGMEMYTITGNETIYLRFTAEGATLPAGQVFGKLTAMRIK